MPKLTDRERLAKIEADRTALALEAETVRRSLRAAYGTLVADIPVERLSEREFKELLTQAVRVGGAAALTALRTLSPASAAPQSPERRPSDEHGAAARRRPAPSGAASSGDGAGPQPAP